MADVIAGYCRRGELRAVGGGRAMWGNGEVFQLISQEYGDCWNFPAEKALELMDQNEVERAVLMHGSMYGFQNQYHFRLMQRFPDRFCASCTVDPYMTNHMETMKCYLEELGFLLVKFEISSGGGLMGCHDPFSLASDRMMEIYELIEKNHGVVALDVGDITMPSHQPESIEKIADTFPGLKVVVCHLLAPMADRMNEWRKSLELLRKDNVWFDIAALPKIVGTDVYPYPEVNKIVAEAKDILGADRMMWGTDAPFAAVLDTYEHLSDYLEKAAVFTKEELENLYYKNAYQVYFS
ncbi:MAG: amidohydrolase [Clostridiales bacterium]|nr:amidohydrolase [Clostridiales bacterium]